MKKILLALFTFATLCLPVFASAQMTVPAGGTGIGTATAGDIPYAATTNPLRFNLLHIGPNGTCVESFGGVPVWLTCSSGGGSGGSTFSTTTSQTPGEFVNYPNNSTDIVNIGSTSTTTGKVYFDPNISFAKIFNQFFGSSSTTLQNFTFVNATGTSATTTNFFSTNLFGTTGNLTNLTVGNTITGSVSGNAGTATALATGRTISISGDLAYTSPTFDGSGNVTAAGTLATVNTNVGSFGSSSAIPNFTVNGKGLITAAGTNAVVAPAGTLTGTTLASNVVTSSLTSIGTLASGAVPASLVTAGTFGTGNYIFPAQLQVNSSTTLQNFTGLNSTTTHATTTSFAISSLGTPAGTFLAVNPQGAVIATTSPSGGTVTNVATDATLTGGPITTTGTLGINLTNPNTWTGKQIFGNASSSLLSTTYASSTTYFGANLASCAGASNALTWSGGIFGCNTITGGNGAPYPFPNTNNSTSTLTGFTGGISAGASSTLSNFTFTNATGTQATTTNLSTALFFAQVPSQRSGLLPLITAASTTGTNIFTVLGNGNVGFGATTSPEAPVTFAQTGGLNSPDFIIDGVNGATGAEMELNRGSNTGTEESNIDFNTNGTEFWQLGMQDNNSNDFELWDGLDNPAFTIKQGGNDIGIATTTPYAELTVWGDSTGPDKAFEIANNASTSEFSVKNNGLTTLVNLQATASSSLQNFTGLNSTTTNATTTNIVSTTASTTNFFGANLITCNTGGSSALTWSGGQFGCNSISGGSGAPYPFQGTNNSTSTLVGFTGGLYSNASATLQAFTFTNSTGTSATTTNFFTTTASTTNLSGSNISGFGLTSCTGTSALTYSGTGFTCTAQPQGTVTAIGVATANGVSGSSSGGATPNLTITLGAITPTSVVSGGLGHFANLWADGSSTLQNFTALNSTTTNATTTSIVSTTATTTNFFGANLIGCNSASNALTWSAGKFGCNTISSSSASSTLLGDNNTFTGSNVFNSSVMVGTGSAATSPFLEINGGTNSGTGPYIPFAKGSSVYGEIGEDSVINGGTGNDLSIYAPASTGINFYTGATERMYITSAGSVGIGTTTPEALLELYGDNKTLSLRGSGTSRVFQNFFNTGGQGILGLESSAGGSIFTNGPAYATGIGTSNATPLEFGTNNSFVGIFDTSGNFGVGTSTPTSRLQVFSTGTSTVSIDSNSTTKGSCIEMKDAVGGGYTYIYSYQGNLFSSTVSCK